MNQTLGMVSWVIDNPGRTVAEVCARFGFNEEGLRKRLNNIFLCGLPGYGPGDLIETVVDEQDRVYIEMADYFERAPRLTPLEVLLLIAAGMAWLETPHAPQALASAVAKLAQTLSPGPESLLAVDISETPELVAELSMAATESKVVELEYLSTHNLITQRKVEPWRVFPALGLWYLSGFCRHAQAERMFRVDRIKSWALTEDFFTPPPTSSIPPGFQYLVTEEDIYCEIVLFPPAFWVLEYYPVEVLDRSDTLVRVRFGTRDPRTPARLLLQLGPHAQRVSGEEVGQALQKMQTEVLTDYQTDKEISPRTEEN